MTIEEEMQLAYKRQIELQHYGRIPRERQISQKALDKRRKAAKLARKARRKGK